ncbi:hypothetical protein, partial [Streptomyces rhizosphaericus]|uniref:hypothetical protein n=1 Tax=Streptomyces rhizosphaericus TaxID=114699 RepID=UPI0031D431E7
MRMKSFAKHMSWVAMMLFLSACSGMPGGITERTSSFDGSPELSMKPAFIYRNNNGFSGSNLEASLHWRSSMPRDEIVLTMYAQEIKSIPSRESLKFNVDGVIKEFSSIDTFTDFSSSYGSYTSWATVPPSRSSFKRYLVSEDFIKEIISADDVRVRLD